MRNKSRIAVFVISIVFTLSMSLIVATGCSAQTAGKNDPVTNTEATEAPPEASPNTSDEPAGQSENENNQAQATSKKNSLETYIDLLGLNKEELITALNESPSPVDEGGLEFKEAGIRVWFDQGSVSQVFTMRKDIDFNGAKIGDNISTFKEAFGEPVSDQNSDAHFKYNDIFLSVNYDTNTGETFAVYVLKKDF